MKRQQSKGRHSHNSQYWMLPRPRHLPMTLEEYREDRDIGVGSGTENNPILMEAISNVFEEFHRAFCGKDKETKKRLI